jgi:hemerythrin-like domain-containing protein
MNAFELLKADHKKVAELFDRLEAASGKAKLDVFKQINSELELHTHIEEKIFYPAIEKPEETHDLTLEAYEEHEVVKTLLAELAGAKTADDEWQAKAKVLQENVEHHVEEEENELFDKADDVLSDEEIEALGNRMEAEKARKQGRPASKQPAQKSAKAGKGSASEPGILSKIADFVGLRGDTGNKKSGTKSSAKKAEAQKRSKGGTKKKAGKPSSKRSAAGQGSRRAAASRSRNSGKKSGSSSTKTAKKK